MRKINEIKSHAWDMLMEGRWFGPIIVCVFTMLLSAIITVLSVFFQTNNAIVTIAVTVMLSICIIIPFSMGAKIYMLEFVRGNGATVGSVFDGFNYAIKLIPITIISLASSYILAFAMNFMLLYDGNFLFGILGFCLLIAYLIINVIINYSMYLIYDNDGKVFKSLKDITVFMLFKGGLVKYILLILSYTLWILAILISFGMLTFFVFPYMEAAGAVFYDDIYTFIRSGN